MTTQFAHGPFIFTPGRALRVAGTPSRRWSYNYGDQQVAERVLSDAAMQSDVIEAFGDDRAALVRHLQAQHAPDVVELIDYETGNAVASIAVASAPGLTPGLIDERSRYWLRSADRLRNRAVTLWQFAALAVSHAAPPMHWIVGILPEDVLTTDPDQWRAPTSWEIRKIVGEGSFTGISGAQAAELVGVSPQNFRKYTAREGASTRQNMSFAMWHLLLHKLGVKRA